MTGTFPEAWEETAFVSIMLKGGTALNFMAATDSVDINEGDNPGEGIPNLAGGRIWKRSGQEDGEITLEMYPISCDMAKGLVISSINGDGTTTTLSTSAAHGMSIGDKFTITNTTNYGTTAVPITFTVNSVTDSDTVTVLSAINQAEETDGTCVAYLSNKGIFQQYNQPNEKVNITTIDGDADSIDIVSAAHTLAIGDIVEVAGTTNYNGKFVAATVADNTHVTFTDETHSESQETTGTIKKIADASQPLATDTTLYAGVDKVRDKFMIAIMWTNDTSQLSAINASSGADFTALRCYAKECRMTSHKTSFTDGILKVTVTLKFPALNKAGTTKSLAWQSTDDTDTTPLTALTYA